MQRLRKRRDLDNASANASANINSLNISEPLLPAFQESTGCYRCCRCLARCEASLLKWALDGASMKITFVSSCLVERWHRQHDTRGGRLYLAIYGYMDGTRNHCIYVHGIPGLVTNGDHMCPPFCVSLQMLRGSEKMSKASAWPRCQFVCGHECGAQTCPNAQTRAFAPDHSR